jgi:hypothetical protein
VDYGYEDIENIEIVPEENIEIVPRTDTQNFELIPFMNHPLPLKG